MGPVGVTEDMPSTLEEIAKHAGVSRSTVSRVMNDHPSVDQATRSRVLSVAERLNYQPNMAARSLAAGRARILGLVIPMGVSALFTDPRPGILLPQSKENPVGRIVDATIAAVSDDPKVVSPVFIKGLRFRALYEAAARVNRDGLNDRNGEAVLIAAARLFDAMESNAERAHAAFLMALSFQLTQKGDSDGARAAWVVARELQLYSLRDGKPGTPPVLFDRLYGYYAPK